MSEYVLPAIPAPAAPPKNEAVLIASGDLRPAANKVCWPAQRDMEERLAGALAKEGWRGRRGDPLDEPAGHRVIDNPKRGIEGFRLMHSSAPLIMGEAGL